MIRITKEFSFSASHLLPGLRADHPCSRLHGHNYRIEIELSATELTETGFVVDYRDLHEFQKMIDDEMDHRHLNDVVPFAPTAENLAIYLYRRAKSIWPSVSCMKVSETPKTWAEYREDLPA